MSLPLNPKGIAVLHHLAKHGDKNRLELERELGIAQLPNVITKLRRSVYVTSLAKERGELMRYQITAHGRSAIGAHLQRQQSMRYRPLHELPPYVPKESPVRAGSMRAYQLPSRGMT